MKVDVRFHCFGCGTDGDVIDFAAKFFQLPLRYAVEKLASDFGLSSNSDVQSYPVPKIKMVKLHRQMDMVQALYECRALLTDWRIWFAPESPEESLHPCFVASLHYADYLQYLLENRKDLIMYRKEVQQIVQQIRKFQTDYFQNLQNALAG